MSEQIKSSRLRTDGLDFDQIKANLIAHLRSYPEFTDFDFSGSALSTLIDVLAYNTHYMGVHAHVATNESFLDSAMNRSSIVSRAKGLGYVPRSFNAPKAIVNVQVSAISGSPPTIVLPKGTRFYTNIAGETYYFTTIEDYHAEKNSGTYLFENVEIYQGKLLNYKFNVTNENGPGVLYRLPNKNVDTKKIDIRVQENQQSTNYETFYTPENFVEVTGDSAVYFIQESFDGFYELEFGDGILGKRLQDGNIILIEYLVTDNSGNGIGLFNTSWSTYGVSTVTTVTKAFGGNTIEDEESVRFTAPKFYEAQNRAITTNDYQSIIANNYANINSVAVWGGEDNDPPIYGKVFISIDTINGEPLTEGAKEDIKQNIIRKYNVVSVIPEVINPEVINLNLIARVTYDPTKTVRTNSEIQSLISEKVQEYFSSNIEKHNTNLYHSKMTRFIDDSETSILSTDIEVTLCLKPDVVLNSTRNYTFNFVNQIEPGTVTSTKFSYFNNFQNTDVVLYDDYNGNIYLRRTSNDTFVSNPIGTVNYETGVITLTNLRISGFSTPLRVYVDSQYDDVNVKRNIILKLNSDGYDAVNRIKKGLMIVSRAITTGI